MARPNKTRYICRMPDNAQFSPVIDPTADRAYPVSLSMSLEEYEAIRLMDYVSMSQKEAAIQMGVSRTTIQMLYASARRKLARFLVEGAQLRIEGGNYELCSSSGTNCPKNQIIKGENNMKIAVTYENGQVFQHFGHTEEFKVYDVEDGKIISSEIVSTNGQGHGALANFLFGGGINVLICGGIGGGARNALAEAGITLYPGASGDADAQVLSFLQGNLQYDPDTMCSHHSQETGHSCGEHGCGSDHCH